MDIKGRYEESKNAVQIAAYRYHTNGSIIIFGTWNDNKLANKYR